ncbi:MAG: hypothetical protein ACXWHF_07045, partial [Chthoniobacterales bacterium]
YDLANHPLTVNLTTTSDGDTLGQMRSFSYVGERLEQSTQRNGTTTTYTYAGLAGASPTPTPSPSPSASPSSGWGRVATQTTRGPGSVLLDQRTYTYDRSQNLTDRQDTRPGGPQLRFHYDYDPADRDVHTQVTSGGPALRDTTYTYDPMGNRLNVGGLNTPNPGGYFQDATTPAPADAQMHQYTTTPLGSYMYDANGNRINLNGGGGNTNFKYDYANRLIDLTNVNTGLRIANYQYDALGRRIQKTLDPDGTPSVTNFVYTGRTVLEERDAGGAVTAAYSLFWSPGYDWVEPCVVATVDPYRGEGVSWYSGDSSSWEHQFEFAIDRTPMGESEIWWFSLRSMDTGKTWQRLASGDGRLMVMHGRHGIDGEDVTLTNIYDMSTAPIEIRRGGVNYAYHAEVVPWLWLMTNSSGAAAERYDYEDFGDPHVFDGSGTPLITSAIGNTYLFKGMRFDAESGLYCITKNLDCSSPSFFNFDPKIGASLQRESNHAVNGWGGVLCAIDTFIWFEEQAGRAKK